MASRGTTDGVAAVVRPTPDGAREAFMVTWCDASPTPGARRTVGTTTSSPTRPHTAARHRPIEISIDLVVRWRPAGTGQKSHRPERDWLGRIKSRDPRAGSVSGDNGGVGL